ncbi:MAG: hypothetical protein CSA15_11665 [Candidatus Delongbacteria bacterium]|nr:MAG: hypothetical protein CSA15_11665 [Candidatus Delongbacteria bacterium]
MKTFLFLFLIGIFLLNAEEMSINKDGVFKLKTVNGKLKVESKYLNGEFSSLDELESASRNCYMPFLYYTTAEVVIDPLTGEHTIVWAGCFGGTSIPCIYGLWRLWEEIEEINSNL